MIPAAKAPRVELSVNGKRCVLERDQATPLLYALRNDLGLKATRFGCGMGLCGACVVQVDGRAVFSCDTTLDQVRNRLVITAEGLDGPVAEALFGAFTQLQAGQCGYCLSGILVRAHALLLEVEAPTREQIAQALERHLCRCGAHQRILDAIELAARLAKVPA
jgi:nicotinate dehydrogenase subunit A